MCVCVCVCIYIYIYSGRTGLQSTHMTPREMTNRHATSPLLGIFFSTQMAMRATSTGIAARIT